MRGNDMRDSSYAGFWSLGLKAHHTSAYIRILSGLLERDFVVEVVKAGRIGSAVIALLLALVWHRLLPALRSASLMHWLLLLLLLGLAISALLLLRLVIATLLLLQEPALALLLLITTLLLATPVVTAVEHLQVIHHDLGGITILAVLALPLACLQAPFEVHPRAFCQILLGNLCQAVEHHH